MKKRILFILFMLSLITHSVYGQTIELPYVNVGIKTEPFVYTQTWGSLKYDNKYVIHTFSITTPMDIIISYCGSTVSTTFVSLKDFSNTIDYTSDEVYSECSDTRLPAFRKKNLPAGEYQVMTSWLNNEIGNIALKILGAEAGTTGSGEPAGNKMSNAIDLGSKSSRFIYSDVQNTNEFTNEYKGENTKDVFYTFTLTSPLNITISHCGSEIPDTYIHLLNENGERIGHGVGGDHEHIAMCDMVGQAYLWANGLPPGTYYVVSEGRYRNGDIITIIEGIAPPY